MEILIEDFCLCLGKHRLIDKLHMLKALRIFEIISNHCHSLFEKFASYGTLQNGWAWVWDGLMIFALQCLANPLAGLRMLVSTWLAFWGHDLPKSTHLLCNKRLVGLEECT